jgi:HD-GYP domain-containing protein (c-di-GMP phosphodiesterase class II)
MRFILPEQLRFLYGVNDIPFCLYLYLDPNVIEYIKPGEYNNNYLKNLRQATEKTPNAKICIREKDYIIFTSIINNSREKKLEKLVNHHNIDPIVAKTYNVVCSMSQIIGGEGVSEAILEQAEDVISKVVDTMTTNTKVLATLNKVVQLDPTLYDHSAMVSIMCGVIAGRINFSGMTQLEAVREVAKCGLFHDVGKLRVPLAILNKPGKLTPEEFDEIKKHPGYGKVELSTLEAPLVSIVAYQHHEKFDGSGYPKGKKGRYETDKQNGIHVFSRICCIADVYSALIVKRCYKQAYTPEETIDIMMNQMSGAFDPKLLQVFLTILVESTDSIENDQKTVNYREFLQKHLMSVNNAA